MIPANQQFDIMEALPKDGREYIYAVTSVDLNNNESQFSNFVVIHQQNNKWRVN
jgi:hypothetical protein